MITETWEKVLVLVLIILALTSSLLLLADDSRKFLFDKNAYRKEKEILKSWAFWKLFIQFTIVLFIYNVGSLAGRMSWGATITDMLWNRFVFGGMPRYAAGAHSLNWWNQINVFMNATVTLAFTNPLGLLLFLTSGVWMIKRLLEGKKRIWANYTLVIVLELLMLFTARWNV